MTTTPYYPTESTTRDYSITKMPGVASDVMPVEGGNQTVVMSVSFVAIGMIVVGVTLYLIIRSHRSKWRFGRNRYFLLNLYKCSKLSY